ncbi:hypothetical protein VKT23_015914 [Stygiomarasmius scandens]|uniref:Protein kinase domain-containing protein n=1 Tax=Marasmiellus scandens TaxID=2682957 RepID=A0ABR1IWC0_9AGAR
MPLHISNGISSTPLYSPYRLFCEPLRLRSPKFLSANPPSPSLRFLHALLAMDQPEKQPDLSLPAPPHPVVNEKLNVTPQSKCVSSQMNLDENHKVGQVNEYLAEDIKERVRVSRQDFLRLFLDLTESQYSDLVREGGPILRVMSNVDFRKAWSAYLGVVKTEGTSEKDLYLPLVTVVVAALAVFHGADKPFFLDASGKVVKGSYAIRRPDLHALLQGLNVLVDDEKLRIHWPIIAWWLEVKHRQGQTLDRGHLVYDVVQNSETTSSSGLQATDMTAGNKRKSEASDISNTSSSTPQPSVLEEISATRDGQSGGRITPTRAGPLPEIDDTDEGGQKRMRVNDEGEASIITRQSGDPKSPVLGSELSVAAESALKGTELVMHTLLQCAGYGLEMLSSGLLRSHSISLLLDSLCLQGLYYGRSKIVLSEVTDLSSAEGLQFFVVILFQLSNLSGRQLGLIPIRAVDKIAESPLPVIDPILNSKYQALLGARKGKGPSINDKFPFPGCNAFHGCQLQLGDGTTLLLKTAVYRAHSIIGRGTTVIKAVLNGHDVVVKLSFPGSSREAEDDLIRRAHCAASSTEHAWAKNHLPTVIRAETHPFGGDTSQTKLATFFEKLTIPYETRVLRITVQEVLQPITDLTDPEEIAQVFFDILQIHRWLVDHGKILHRDISLTNIMFRRISGNVYGVLNDFDLASSLPVQPGTTSLRRTGTLPYMSIELLNKTCTEGPVYHHDLESLFYVLAVLCCHYDKGSRGLQKVDLKKRRFHSWFSGVNSSNAADKVQWLEITNWESVQTTSFFGAQFSSLIYELREQLRMSKHKVVNFRSGDLWSRLHPGRQPPKHIQDGLNFDILNRDGIFSYETFKDAIEANIAPTNKRLIIRYCTPLALQRSDFILPRNQEIS